ncbi:outer membrane protein assembly factor BamD [Geopsychrobacter electrodiphilus]|uniref:outer membrane protein assembly factor BamD n=1 Tax=Geopsychrobacter electrodiphilus TaxID=225196 RepID=UPI000372A342|nr:outer membrane protein assembly factor BamD [Geopsychrobacter electrodiphilus]
MFRSLLFSLILLILLTACNPTIVPPPRSADYYFKEGERFFDSHLYEDAVASWKKVRDSYYSPELNKLAELKIAEAQYLSDNFEEAASSYSAFVKEHPRDKRLPDALYFLGMSYYKQMLSEDRDQTATENALHTFQRFMKDYPSDKRIEEVSVLVQRTRNRLAEREVYIGRFYLRTGHYQAAINRLKGILKEFPNYYYRDEAFFYLGTAYLKLHRKKEAADIFNTLFDQFPDSQYISQAQKILAKDY